MASVVIHRVGARAIPCGIYYDQVSLTFSSDCVTLSVIPPMLYTPSHISTTVMRRIIRESWKPAEKKEVPFYTSGNTGQ
jgi:hypothetical protein